MRILCPRPPPSAAVESLQAKCKYIVMGYTEEVYKYIDDRKVAVGFAVRSRESEKCIRRRKVHDLAIEAQIVTML